MRRLDLTEVGVKGLPIQAVLADGVEVIRAIEQVVEFAAEGEHPALTEHSEAFLDGKIHVYVVRPGKSIAARVAITRLTRGGLQEVRQEP